MGVSFQLHIPAPWEGASEPHGAVGWVHLRNGLEAMMGFEPRWSEL